MGSSDLSKKAKRAEKVAKKAQDTEEGPAAKHIMDAPTPVASTESSAQSYKKRKRDSDIPEELEIDISLPEPPSKKALRKAKKQKSTSGGAVSDAKDGRAGQDESAEDGRANATGNTAANNSDSKRGLYGIWIGNLPFSITKAMLHTFFTTTSQPPIPQDSITRINIPAPAKAAATKTSLKPQNKGFAYVDFADEQSFMAALALSETPLGGRNVLIKNAKSFEGRPEPPKDAAEAKSVADGKQKKPSRRVFVGNLGFDVTKEDLQHLYSPCGTIEDIHMATFEDSGKCKGFAWVRFAEVEAAEAAVKGWTRVPEKAKADEAESDAQEEPDSKKPKKEQTRKWFVNRLSGRSIRCEFAEDASVRYKKRFGKEAAPGDRGDRRAIGDDELQAPIVEVDSSEPPVARNTRNKHSGISPGGVNDPTKRRGRTSEPSERDRRHKEKVQELSDQARYRTGALTESKGSKMVFA